MWITENIGEFSSEFRRLPQTRNESCQNVSIVCDLVIKQRGFHMDIWEYTKKHAKYPTQEHKLFWVSSKHILSTVLFCPCGDVSGHGGKRSNCRSNWWSWEKGSEIIDMGQIGGILSNFNLGQIWVWVLNYWWSMIVLDGIVLENLKQVRENRRGLEKTKE